MTPMTFAKSNPVRRANAPLALVIGAVAMSVMMACSSNLLDVEAPNSVPAEIFDDPANATLMVNSVIGDFECAYGSYVTGTGIATDELQDATITAANWQLDRRDDGFTSGTYGTGSCTNNQGIYTPLSTARWEADQAVNRLNGWTDAQVPNRQSLIAQANVYAGYSYALLGMAMCQAAFDMQAPVDQKGMFTLAEKRFSDAIAAAQAARNTAMLNAAYLGRARMRLFLHNNPGAIADAQLVPTGFVFNAATDAANSRRYNRVFAAINTGGSVTVEAVARRLTTENNEVDPRSATTQLTTRPSDGTSLVFIPAKFNATAQDAGRAIPLPIARYAEAQLIIAEAQGGAQAVSIINAMRAAVNLRPYTGATTAAAITALIAGERQRVLFVEGFRAFDIERFNLPLLPAPSSSYRFGGVYGNTVCLPLPDVERFANPNVDPKTLISGVKGQFPIP
jgi:starch-binding outer membrane protein, SusD/RagB family